ncbi:hypothetical protein G6F35_015505 [Rhizopus arrhizus]|nr:hypothetical protein G6F35_015505 [Rhizopus arrhizus]
MQLHARRITAAAADVVDGTAECQRAMLETVGPAQHFHARQPQRFQQLVGRAARSGQRQAIDRHGNTRGVRARAAVDAGAADGDLGAFIAWRLCADARLVGQHIGAAGQSAVGLGHIDDVAGAGHALQRLACLGGGIGGGDLHRIQRGGLRGGVGGSGEAERNGQEQWRRSGAVRRERHAGLL